KALSSRCASSFTTLPLITAPFHRLVIGAIEVHIFDPFLLELRQKLARTVGTQISQRRQPAGGKGGNRAPQLGELTRRASGELGVGSLAQARHLAERLLDFGIAVFLKKKQRHA